MKKKEILVLQDLLGSNKKIAAEIRAKLAEKGIFTINLMRSPGAGKTTLLERIAEHLEPRYRMAVIEGDIETEAGRVMENLKAVLVAAGSGLDQVVRATIYLTDLGNFEAVNRVYGGYFGESAPARACVEVSRLPRGARVEIDAVARVASETERAG